MADEAVSYRLSPPVPTARGPLSRKRVEALISRSVALFALLFGAQTGAIVAGQVGGSHPLWSVSIVPIFYVALLFALVASLLQRWVRLANGIVAVVYLVAIVSWPVFIVTTSATDSVPWLYYLLTVATAMAAISFPISMAVLYLFAAPTLVLLGRLIVSTTVNSTHLLIDSLYSVILGGAVLIIVTMLRRAASAVDEAQSAALVSYSVAVRQHATEVERVQVDSIVHDGVLTTLLSAARATSPEAKHLAATMASTAMGVLRHAATVGLDSGISIPVTAVSTRIAAAAASSGGVFEVSVPTTGARAIPVGAAEAVVSAATQAMVNSVQHASSATARWVSLRVVHPIGVEVQVGDDGPGFDPDSVARERLGLRVSIIELVANAGGIATVAARPGDGTVVTIRWPGEAQ